MIQRKRSRYSQPLLTVLLVGFLTLAFAVSSTATEQLVLQKSGTNPQTRAAENYLDEANQTTVNADALRVKSSTNANQRSLILFDFSLLPNVGIKTAVLTLTVQTPPTATRTYDAFPLDSLFAQSAATWKTRVADLAWGAAGGDIPGTATTSTTVTNRTAAASWTITPDVQSWYTGNANGVPVPNYGTLIMDSAESSATAYQTVFYSNSAVTPADAPSLTVTFVQNVANLTATAGNAQVTLNWTYPAAIGAVVNATTGVMILRSSSGVPVNKGTVPTDGTTYALCATIGNGTVVYNNTALSTTFTDNSSDTCGAPANGTTYYYKVFTQDSAVNYSTSGTSGDGGSLTVPEDSATPSASAPYSSNWMTATYSTTLAPPSLFPGLVAMLGTQTNFMFSVNPNTGMRSYPPLSLGGAITGRSPVIDAADSSLAEDMVYVADQSGLAYGIAADTGQTVWAVDPLNSGGTPFLAAGALLVKSYATSSYTLSHDLLILGTRNSSTLTGNAIVAVDGNTGATIWTDVGDTGTIPAMDIITATPTISYTANTIWVTSESNGGTQPSLWELNANTGKVLATLSLGDIDSSPVLTPDGSTLFVGTDAGTVYAIKTSTATVITSIAGGDGEIVSYPLVVGFSSPYTVVFSGTADVHGLTYNSSTQTFTANWTTAITTPSAPIGVYGLTDIYVGGGDGLIHELNSSTGVDTRDIVANTGQPGVVGDPGLDISLMHIYVSTNDQRMYSFTFPY
ncbi:MAG: PQQ-binding-like beta-propeller repeat protein [Candidatus Acidiferrales bacterium]